MQGGGHVYRPLAVLVRLANIWSEKAPFKMLSCLKAMALVASTGGGCSPDLFGRDGGLGQHGYGVSDHFGVGLADGRYTPGEVGVCVYGFTKIRV